MSAYIRMYAAPRYLVERKKAADMAAQFENEATVIDGVVRWNSNDQVPPDEIIDFWAYLGKPFDCQLSRSTRQAELSAFLADYREQYAGQPFSDEQVAEMRAEMRANFASGARVVNVITGQTMKF